jgi:hypothetical protein
MKMRPRTVIPIIAIFAMAGISLALIRAIRSERVLRGSARAPKPRAVSISLLPTDVSVPEGGEYSYKFAVPADASNAQLNGEFTAQPRPGAQLDFLVVSEPGFQHWRDFVAPPLADKKPRGGELLYRSGATIADRFQFSLTPGTYYLIFAYGPATGQGDHFAGPPFPNTVYRDAASEISLSYELPPDASETASP